MNPNQRLKHKLNNTLQSVLLILSMAGLLSLLGWLIAGYQGLLWSVVMCLLALIFGSRVSPGVVLRMCRASPIPAWQAPQLYQVLTCQVRRNLIQVKVNQKAFEECEVKSESSQYYKRLRSLERRY